MITEDYVSFETAKLLKEKGFDEACEYVYSNYGVIHRLSDKEYIETVRDFNYITTLQNSSYNDITRYKYDFLVTAPTQQMAMKWLREVHNLLIVPMLWTKHFVNNEIRHFQYCYEIYHLRKGATPIHADTKIMFYTYEQASEAAIKYCLENLI